MTAPLSSGYLPALYDILDFLAQLKDAEEDRVWGRITEKLSVALDAQAATYYGYLPAKRQLLPRYGLGVAARDLSGTAVDVRTGLCGWVALHREPLLVENAYKDERFLREADSVSGFKTQTVLAAPIIDRLDLLGVLEFINKRPAGAAAVVPFAAQDLRFVESACRAAVTALRALKLEARVDMVTARNASIIENLGGGFLAIDTRGEIMLCNPAARRLLDLAPEMPLHIPIEQALKAQAKLAEILLETLSQRRTVSRQDVKIAVRGQDRLLGYSTIIIQDPHGEISGAGITFQDITNVRR